jgi:alpha-methylacyl-CoA racemase
MENTIQYKEHKPASGPLQGIKILDMTRLLPGPLATMIMADMGAEVIKVELPNMPDGTRNYPPFIHNKSVNYIAANRSKRSLAIDYSTEKGKSIIYKLVQQCDIFIEQFRPNYLKKYDLDYESIKKIHPKIIYVSLSGYGQTGKYAHKGGHDINFIAHAGILHLNKKGNDIHIPGTQIADIAGGSYMAVIACLSALWARNQQNIGQYIDVSMCDAALPLISIPLHHYWATQQVPNADEMFLSGALANYNTYVCKDNKHIALGALEPKFWNTFCQIVNKPLWLEKMYDFTPENQAQLKNELQTLFLSKNRDAWIDMFSEYDICISPVLALDEIEQHELFTSRNMICDIEGEKGIANPIHFSATKVQPQCKSPELGEDTHQILKSIGLSDAEILALQSDKII